MNQSQGGNPFGRLVEFARPHKTGYIVSVVLAVLGVAFGIVPYFATARMTIELLSGNQDLSFYMVWCLISGGCFVLKAILMGISTRASHEATFEVLSEARRKIASKLTRVPMGYILNTPSGQLKNGMVERIEQLEVPLAHVIPEMTSNLLVPIAIIVYLFVLDWRMALVSLITIPVGMMCYMGMMKEYPKKYGEVVKAGNHMSATTVEYIGGIEIIKAFNQADNSYQKFTDAVHANADLILDWMKDTQKYSAIMMSVCGFCWHERKSYRLENQGRQPCIKERSSYNGQEKIERKRLYQHWYLYCHLLCDVLYHGYAGVHPYLCSYHSISVGNTGRHPVHAVSDKDRKIRRGYYYGYVGQCPLLSDGTKLDFNSVWNCIRFPG